MGRVRMAPACIIPTCAAFPHCHAGLDPSLGFSGVKDSFLKWLRTGFIRTSSTGTRTSPTCLTSSPLHMPSTLRWGSLCRRMPAASSVSPEGRIQSRSEGAQISGHERNALKGGLASNPGSRPGIRLRPLRNSLGGSSCLPAGGFGIINVLSGFPRLDHHCA